MLGGINVTKPKDDNKKRFETKNAVFYSEIEVKVGNSTTANMTFSWFRIGFCAIKMVSLAR